MKVYTDYGLVKCPSCKTTEFTKDTFAPFFKCKSCGEIFFASDFEAYQSYCSKINLQLQPEYPYNLLGIIKIRYETTCPYCKSVVYVDKLENSDDPFNCYICPYCKRTITQ